MKGFLVVLLLAACIIDFNEGFYHSGKRSMMKVGLYKKTSCFLNLTTECVKITAMGYLRTDGIN